MVFDLKKELTYGNIFTFISIVITLVTLTYSWGLDRQLSEREQANRIRNAASITLGKLHRWEKISYSFFELTQPIYVETSEILSKESDIEKARDYLWKSLNRVKSEISSQIMKEEIEFSYINLYAYIPVIRPIYMETAEKMEEINNSMLDTLLNGTQQDVLSFNSKLSPGKQPINSADIGNRLRFTSNKIKDKYFAQVQKTFEAPIDFLEKLVVKSDKDLLSKQ